MSRFNLGFLTALFVNSLVQDALGKEYLLKNWVDAKITLPLALVGLVLVAWTYSREKK